MRDILLVLVLTTLPASLAAADPLASALAPQKPARIETPDKPLSAKRSSANACAAYGPNFVKVNGSDTCVKVGGEMSVSGGGRR
jgi:hypothetical protein